MFEWKSAAKQSSWESLIYFVSRNGFSVVVFSVFARTKQSIIIWLKSIFSFEMLSEFFSVIVFCYLTEFPSSLSPYFTLLLLSSLKSADERKKDQICLLLFNFWNFVQFSSTWHWRIIKPAGITYIHLKYSKKYYNSLWLISWYTASRSTCSTLFTLESESMKDVQLNQEQNQRFSVMPLRNRS